MVGYFKIALFVGFSTVLFVKYQDKNQAASIIFKYQLNSEFIKFKQLCSF